MDYLRLVLKAKSVVRRTAVEKEDARKRDSGRTHPEHWEEMC